MSTVQKEWQKLQENCRRCLKRREKVTCSRPAAPNIPVCAFFKELCFLSHNVGNRLTHSNLSQLKSQSSSLTLNDASSTTAMPQNNSEANQDLTIFSLNEQLIDKSLENIRPNYWISYLLNQLWMT